MENTKQQDALIHYLLFLFKNWYVIYNKDNSKRFKRKKQYPKADKTSNYNQFTYWAESEWKDMGDKESMTFSGMIGYGLRAVISGSVSVEDLYRSDQNILTGETTYLT